jgi:hypothetical protein
MAQPWCGLDLSRAGLGRKDLRLGTLRVIVRQLALDWQEFLRA